MREQEMKMTQPGHVVSRAGSLVDVWHSGWPVHAVALVLAAAAEWIGASELRLPFGTVVFLPLIYTFLVALLLNPNVVGARHAFIGQQHVALAAPIVQIAILPFIARFGTLIGPTVDKIVAVGPAMVLQEAGNLMAMLIALPIAVLVLRMGRESIGACFSIGREPNVAMIADRYGLDSPEGFGVMGVYVVGGLLGTLFFALVPPLVVATGFFDMRALAMACGVGSASMTAACSGALVASAPDMKGDVLALAGASNLLTNATGLYVSLFVALPLAERLYGFLRRWVPHVQVRSLTAGNAAPEAEQTSNAGIDLRHHAMVLLIVCAVAAISSWVESQARFIDVIPGMAMIYLMVVVGLALAKWIPFYLPTVAWVSLVSAAATCFEPQWLMRQLQPISFLSLVTPVFAYAALAISRNEVQQFRTSGARIVVVSMIVFLATFVGSAVVATLVL